MMLHMICLGLAVLGMQAVRVHGSDDPCFEINETVDAVSELNQTLFQTGKTFIVHCELCAGLLSAESVTTPPDFIVEMTKYSSVLQTLRFSISLIMISGPFHQNVRNELISYMKAVNNTIDHLQHLIETSYPIAWVDIPLVSVDTVGISLPNDTGDIYSQTYVVNSKLRALLNQWIPRLCQGNFSTVKSSSS